MSEGGAGLENTTPAMSTTSGVPGATVGGGNTVIGVLQVWWRTVFSCNYCTGDLLLFRLVDCFRILHDGCCKSARDSR